MNVTDVLIILAKSDVQVPTVPAGSLNTAQTIIALVAAVVAAAGGGGTVVALITARVRKVRQYSDVREDATVENQGLKDAAEMWQSIAVDAREQAKSALGELRGVIEDKDRQIQDQRMIIDDLHALIKIRDQNAEDADRKLAEVQLRLQSAEERERQLVVSRNEIEERLRDAEMHMAETTLDPARIREINAGGSESDRNGLRPLN